MNLDEIKEKARIRIEEDNPGSTDFKAIKVFDNIMDGKIVTVSFRTAAGEKDANHDHFHGTLAQNGIMLKVGFGLRFQPVDATPVLILSAGVSIPLCGVNW
ncbi:MAG: hypothetical protein IIA05_06075 [Proteobacteria bacterium]|nr:hypothetical protein [Pseudomonadota bacterium]